MKTKNMNKVFLTIAVVAISALTVKAQKSVERKTVFSIGVEAGLPVGTSGIGDYYSFVIGGSLQGEYFVAPDLGLTLKAGYLNYIAKNNGISSGIVPVLAGFRYHFTPKVYGAGQLGISFSTESGGGSAFTYSPGIGFMLSEQIDVLARYEAASKDGVTTGNAGVRVAYNF